jgi:hypothetical protein
MELTHTVAAREIKSLNSSSVARLEDELILGCRLFLLFFLVGFAVALQLGPRRTKRAFVALP